MPQTRKLNYSFSGGEVTPEFWGQIADAKFQTGLATCRNMVVLPHGPVANRAGTAYVNTARLPAKKTRLIPFSFSVTQTMVLEFGEGYIRFHTQGATLLSGGVPYEVGTPYVEADLMDLHYVESADVLTIVHPSYPPAELRRLGATNWTYTVIAFNSNLSAPTGATATPSGSSSTVPYAYVVTAVGANGLDESVPSASASCTNFALALNTVYNTITWSAVTGAARYNIYKFSGGLYGYIGQSDTLSFKDDNIIANLGKTAPILDTALNSAGGYPAAVSYHEQRRSFAGSNNEPQNLRMTRSGTESAMTYSIPSRDDDRVNIRVAAREANAIRHIVPLTNLLLLTAAAEWRVTSVNTDAITPSSISVKPQSYVGANNVQPVIVNNNLIFAAARGGHLRELTFSAQANNYTGGYMNGDLSLRAPHLFDNLNIVDMAYSKAPFPVVWSISSSGKLLGLTYVPEQQLGAIHQHDTDGLFESCCVVAEGNEDVLYVVVNRTINGAQTRYIERMASRMFATQADAFFVDAGATYSGAPATTVSGLTWLEGKKVSILGDGSVFPQKVVTGGQITIDQPCSKIQVGLPITADVQTLPLFAQVDSGYAQGRLKNINRVWLRVYKSSGVFSGPSTDRLVQYKQRATEAYGSPPSLISGEIEIVLEPSWQDGGQIYVRQSDPLPLTLVSMTLEAELSG